MTARPLTYGALILLAVGATACARPASPEVHKDSAEQTEKEPFGRVTVDELAAKMQAAQAGQLRLAIYDNNNPERFAQSHIPGARWVSFNNLQASDLPPEKDAMLVFYCANEH